jgi:hypothetical protein
VRTLDLGILLPQNVLIFSFVFFRCLSDFSDGIATP